MIVLSSEWWLFLPVVVTLSLACSVSLAFSPIPTFCIHSSSKTPLLMSEKDEAIDEDDEMQQAYGSRSLEWTNKYRRVIPYEKARTSVMDLGLRDKSDWDEYVADGKIYHGPYLPNHPDQMYHKEWVSWDEFLGITRQYNETRGIVQMLQLKDMQEYKKFVNADIKRARGLRIPAKPEIVYRNKGWISMEHFFGDCE